MPGLAQQKYQERGGKCFWEFSSPNLLRKLLNRGLIQEIDLLFVKQVLASPFDEDLALLCIYLFSASCQGHLCVQLTSSLQPSLSQVWTSEQGLSKEEINELETKIIRAKDLLVAKNLKKPNWIVLEGSCLYLQKNELFEREVFEDFIRLEETKPDLEVDTVDLSSNLLPKQKEAIKNALQYGLSFITGGPGVGKTFTASHLLHAFFKKHPKAKVALVAPTGKAVANLQSNFLKFLEKESASYQVEVFTLHKLFNQKIYSYLPYDLILVDESSMIDLGFMRKLLKYAKPRSRLIFLGDPNQLPPIESGFVFHDLILLSHHKSHLTECLRVELKELIESAEAVKRGDDVEFLKLMDQKKAIYPLENKDEDKVYEQLVKGFKNDFSGLNDLEILNAFQKYKILSPVRKGRFGVDQINHRLKEYFSSEVCTPILITSNDYRLELFNGDVGVLKGDEAIFIPRHTLESYYDPKRQVRVIPQILLSSYEYAYCLSVHKSQGSEYEKVALMLPASSEVFGRELLYTALTRAKKVFEIYSDRPTLQKMIKESSMRYSGLQIRGEHYGQTRS